jgi:5-methylcytosine-specific restriction endonuclease McrA
MATKTGAKRNRPDQNGTHRRQFELNKKRIFSTQRVCGICGQPVDMNLKYPDPLSPCIDHIIPIAKGGHPSDIENLQLAHWTCNRQKSDKLIAPTQRQAEPETIGNRVLPQSMRWIDYRG